MEDLPESIVLAIGQDGHHVRARLDCRFNETRPVPEHQAHLAGARQQRLIRAAGDDGAGLPVGQRVFDGIHVGGSAARPAGDLASDGQVQGYVRHGDAEVDARELLGEVRAVRGEAWGHRQRQHAMRVAGENIGPVLRRHLGTARGSPRSWPA